MALDRVAARRTLTSVTADRGNAMKYLRNTAGFTIVEVILVLGLASLVALAVALH